MEPYCLSVGIECEAQHGETPQAEEFIPLVCYGGTPRAEALLPLVLYGAAMKKWIQDTDSTR